VLVGEAHVGLVTDMTRKLQNIGIPVIIVGALGVLTALLTEGRLSQQAFAMGCVVVMVLAVITWTILSKRSNRSTQSPDMAASPSSPNTGKKKGLQVALLLLFLVIVLWATRGGPWIPRLIGASMLLLFTAGIALRKTD